MPGPSGPVLSRTSADGLAVALTTGFPEPRLDNSNTRCHGVLPYRTGARGLKGGNGEMERGNRQSEAATTWLPIVVELPSFSPQWGRSRLTEAGRTVMLGAMLSGPEAWPIQRETAGASETRFSSQDLDCGTSGGYRVFRVVYRKYGKIVLVTLFPIAFRPTSRRQPSTRRRVVPRDRGGTGAD